MRIVDLADGLEGNDDLVEGVAGVLREAFAGNPFAWPTEEAAIAEVQESLTAERVSMVAIEDDVPVGWIGGAPGYGGVTWELHPLAVVPGHQGKGIGRALVDALEDRVRALGGRNLWLTTDDAAGRTNLFDVDLYPDIPTRLDSLQVRRGHPIAFYHRLGFVVTGVIPDAYGPGMHEFLMAKRLG